MLIAVYSIGKVVGAELWLAGCMVCALVFVAVCCAFKRNRGRKGLTKVLLGLLASEMVCDMVWFLAYYPGGEYRNYGIGGVYGVLLWPAALAVAGVIVTVANSHSSEPAI